jgi:hypothetical protein
MATAKLIEKTERRDGHVVVYIRSARVVVHLAWLLVIAALAIAIDVMVVIGLAYL